VDSAAGLMSKPKQPPPPVNQGMTINEYAEYWNKKNAQDKPGVADPVVPAIPLPAEKILTSKDFEPTILGSGVELAGEAAPVPFAGKAASSLILAAGIWQAFRHNSKKNGQIKALVESIDKEGTPALKKLVEKKVIREGVFKQLHKVVKVVKAASALKALPPPAAPSNGA